MTQRPRFHEACTKIVATVGPACDQVPELVALIEAGVDVFRINSAHGSQQQHAEKLANIRIASEQTGFPVGVLLDLAGPKIRLGNLKLDPLPCHFAQEVTFVRGESPANDYELTSSYERLVDELDVGDCVMLADGTVALEVIKATKDRATCRVTAGGEVRSRQGINLPGVRLSVSAMLPSDFENAIWAAKNGIDFISLSFVRSAEDVRSLKALLTTYESAALVIAKIEKPEALDDLERIVRVADGVMVARGDLGVEIDVAETPVAQKRIIQVCKQQMKPVIVATQMLESMHHSRRPTRAEASDVANAVLDGADACMLSGETAIGDFPVDAVATMNRIMRKTEQRLLGGLLPPELLADSGGDERPGSAAQRVREVTLAVTEGATSIAEAIGSKLIVVATHSGNTAWVKSNSRSLIPTLAISDHDESVRRMNLFWGIKPMGLPRIEETSQLIEHVCRWGTDQGGLTPGDNVVIVTGSGVMHKAHNMLLVHTVE